MATYVPALFHLHQARAHTWQTQFWARIARRAGRHWVMSRHIDQFLRPLTIEGREHLARARGPMIIIPNHSSHFDTPAALSVLPERIRAHTAVAAAADKFYRPDKKGWWYSLFFNAFPIERGGGSAALDYAKTLLHDGWSILMYPEGTRSVDGEMARFHHGVSLLALDADVPVVPIYMEGLRDVLPKGQREPRASAVHIRIGAPVRLEPRMPVPDGTAQLEQAMRALAGRATVAAA